VQGASNLSGLVANDLSGFMLCLKEVQDETEGVVAGPPEDVF
jgi:hypothetical protein